MISIGHIVFQVCLLNGVADYLNVKSPLSEMSEMHYFSLFEEGQ